LFFAKLFLYKKPLFLFFPHQRESAISDILDAQVFWDATFGDGFFLFLGLGY
jgi:hypothetical protein